MRRRAAALAVLSGLVVLPLAVFLPAAPQAPARPPLDKAAEKWVQDTLKKMTLDEKVGQLLAPSIDAMVTSTDSEVYEKKLHLVRDLKVGAIHVFGGSEPMPAALLNPNYPPGGSAGRKGDPLAAATFLNRLQQASAIPLLTTADFEGGAGYILNGTTRLPRAMAIAATRDPQLAYKAGFVSATEARAIGITVDFYPVLDVNNNPRNPIINIRSFGEDVGLVSEMGVAYMRGIQAGGALATAKHFPGHGDTSVDTHLGLAKIDHPREHLERVELPPFRAAVDAGIDAFMSTPHHPARARPGARHPGHAQPADSHRSAPRRDEVRRPHLHRLDGDGCHLEELRRRPRGGDGGEGRRRLRAALAGR